MNIGYTSPKNSIIIFIDLEKDKFDALKHDNIVILHVDTDMINTELLKYFIKI